MFVVAALFVGGCRGWLTSGDDIARAPVATKIKQLADETREARQGGKLAFKAYRKADPDLDGLRYADDNCPRVHNRDQANSDGDFLGDACDDLADKDTDSVQDLDDNCEVVWNKSQWDFDDDGYGDACDPDMDNDGIDNLSDTDMDGDGYESVEDRDNDGDGYVNEEDNFDWYPAYA